MERIKAVLLLTVIVVAFGLYTAWDAAFCRASGRVD